LHLRCRKSTYTTHVEPQILLVTGITAVMVGNVVGVMNDATNAVQDLLAEIALVWARRIINMRHLAINASCTMK
jgi:hypothetical protein